MERVSALTKPIPTVNVTTINIAINATARIAILFLTGCAYDNREAALLYGKADIINRLYLDR